MIPPHVVSEVETILGDSEAESNEYLRGNTDGQEGKPPNSPMSPKYMQGYNDGSYVRNNPDTSTLAP